MVKVAFIGAGSVEFTKNVVTDLCAFEELHGALELSFHDIDATRLGYADALARRISDQTGAGARVSSDLDRLAPSGAPTTSSTRCRSAGTRPPAPTSTSPPATGSGRPSATRSGSAASRAVFAPCPST